MLSRGRHTSIRLNITESMEVKAAIVESGKILGFPQLKNKQIAALTSFINDRDTFVSLPTGYGKSIIYAALRCHWHLI